jgi:hypothetical protein
MDDFYSAQPISVNVLGVHLDVNVRFSRGVVIIIVSYGRHIYDKQY